MQIFVWFHPVFTVIEHQGIMFAAMFELDCLKCRGAHPDDLFPSFLGFLKLFLFSVGCALRAQWGCGAENFSSENDHFVIFAENTVSLLTLLDSSFLLCQHREFNMGEWKSSGGLMTSSCSKNA